MGKHGHFPQYEGMEYYFAGDARLVTMVIRTTVSGCSILSR